MKRKIKTVSLTVESGIVEVGRLPKGVRVRVKDYDMDGSDEKLKRDSNGQYALRVYEA